MTDLERRLTTALERLSAQYGREQRLHYEQVEALRVTDLTGYSGTYGEGPTRGLHQAASLSPPAPRSAARSAAARLRPAARAGPRLRAEPVTGRCVRPGQEGYHTWGPH